MEQDAKIFVTGHNGLVGSALVRELTAQGYMNLMTIPRSCVDLCDPIAVRWLFSVHEPEYVFHCAAHVGGIRANAANPVDFFSKNILMQQNVMLNAALYRVKKFLFLGSSCIYPRECEQPIKESALLTGPLEKTNEAYALAKVSGVKMCQWLRQERGLNFVSAMPCNVHGPQDNFDGKTAHIIPGLIARMHAAKKAGTPTFNVWGRADTLREYIYSEDLARALIVVMKDYNEPEPINTGSSFELSVEKLARIIAGVVGYYGQLQFDARMPAGTPRKLLDNQKLINLGWSPRIGFKHSLELTYAWFTHALKNGTLRASEPPRVDVQRDSN